jgi:hypothetical protein
MLSPTKTGLVALAAATSAFLLPSSAEAARLFGFRFFEPNYYTYYPGPDDAYSPYYGAGRDYYYVPRRKRHHYYDQYDRRYQQNQQDSYYDPQYDPQYDAPVTVNPPKRKTAITAPVAKPVVKKATVATVKKPATSAGGMSCDKAGSIISGYGFSSVTPNSCKGDIYAFSATRSGKNYRISLNAASGELTEVKKVQ